MASKRRVRRRQCQGKIRHRTAQGAAYHRFLLSLHDSDQMNIYKCKSCGGYHLGHTRRNRRRDFI